MTSTIAGSSGFICGRKRCTSPSGVQHELLEVPLDRGRPVALDVLGLLQLLVERRGLLPLTLTLSKTGNVTPHVVEQYSRISSIFDRLLARNWLHGKPST